MSKRFFLGIASVPNGLALKIAYIQALLDFAPPKTVQGMRRFLGMLNYYCHYMQHAVQSMAPLIDALSATKSKGATLFPWTPDLLANYLAYIKMLACSKRTVTNGFLLPYLARSCPRSSPSGRLTNETHLRYTKAFSIFAIFSKCNRWLSLSTISRFYTTLYNAGINFHQLS